MEIKNNKIVATPRSKYHKYLFGGSSSGSSSGGSISIDTNNFVKKTGETSQTVEGDFIVNGNIISTGEVSAYGAGSGSGGGSGSGIIQTVFGSAELGGSYLDSDLTNTFNAYTINLINNNLTSALGRIGALETSTPNVAWGVATGQYSPLTINSVTRNLSVDGHTHSYLPLSGGQLTGQLSLLQGAGGGIIFPNNSFGGGGDSASIKLLNPIGGESTEMTFTMTNDADDIINFSVPSIDGVKVNRYTVWHAGNDGAGSGLDADTIDGLHSSSFFKVVSNNPTSVNDYTFWENSAGRLYNTPDAPYNYYSFLSFGQGIYQTQFNGYNNSLKFRSGSESGLTNKSWRTVAFTDSNVASATKLDTSRTIWGQNFDGTGNVTGDLTLSGNLNLNTSANQINTTSAAELVLNYAGGGARHTSIFNGQGGFVMRAHANGNVGIGTSEPQYKLDVNGSTKVNGYFRVSNDTISAGEYEDIAYGFINVCRTASIENASYFSMVRAGIAAFGIGLSTDNSIIIGGAGGGKTINDIHLKLNGNFVITDKPLSSSSRIFTGFDSGAQGSISCSNWFRSSGDSGWYNQTYGGGIYMTDTTYVKVSHNKSFWVDGNIVATGEVTAYSASDIRLKTNIQPITSAIDVLNKLNPVTYNWNEKAKELNPLKTDSTEYGLIAQELEEVLPELVHPIYDGEYKSVDYVKIVPLLIGAIKELQLEINELKNK